MILARLVGQESAVDMNLRFRLAAFHDLVEQNPPFFMAGTFWVPLPRS